MPFDVYYADYSGEKPRDTKRDFDTLPEAEAFVVDELKGEERSEQGGTILFKVPVPGGSSFYTAWIEERGSKESGEKLVVMDCGIEGHRPFLSSLRYCADQGGIKNVCPMCVAASNSDQTSAPPGATDDAQRDQAQ